MLSSGYRIVFLGLFCLLMVFLFWLTATMDASRIEKSMVQILENKGKLILEAMDSLAKERFKDFVGTQQKGYIMRESWDLEEGFRIQEEILHELYALMEEFWDVEKVDLDALKRTLEEKGIYAYVFIVENQIYSSKELPERLLDFIKDMIKSPEALFFRVYNEKDVYYIIGKKDTDGTRTLLFVLDFKAIEGWALRVVLKESIELVWQKDIKWVSFINTFGNTILFVGEVEVHSKDLLEVSYESSLKEGYRLKAGIDISFFVKLNDENKRHIIYTTVVMSLFSILLVIVFYRIQLVYSKRMESMKERLMREQRLSSLGRLAAGLAHEIRNPLNAIAMAVQRLHLEFVPKDLVEAKEFAELVSSIKDQIKRLNNLVDEFTAPMRREIKMKPQNIVYLINRLIALLEQEFSSKNIRIKTKFERNEIVANVDEGRFEQVLLNIIKNASEAIGENGEISIWVYVEKENKVAIKISDTGKGIPPEDLDRIFEMEYTTKEKGLGLGLPISHEIIKAHGGEILVESEPGRGATFIITLPVWEG